MFTNCSGCGTPAVPIVRVRTGEDATLVLLEQSPDSAQRLLRTARARYTEAALRLLDGPSRRWLLRNDTPYRATLLNAERNLHAGGGAAGFWTLNASYEWACTAGIAASADDSPRHLRVLDWDTPGLGHELHAVIAGEAIMLTWPGFAGCVTGLRAGAFSLALNQPPLPGPTVPPTLNLAGQALGWLRTRPARWRGTAIPPSHLLRLVLERCDTADAALAMLESTPVCAGAIFSMAGTEPGEGWLIEKDVHRFVVHRGTGLACANHWPSDPAAIARRLGSRERAQAMQGTIDAGGPLTQLDWLRPPILVDETRLACVMDPRNCTVLVQGFEAGRPVTAVTQVRA